METDSCHVMYCNDDGHWGRTVVAGEVVNICLCKRHIEMVGLATSEEIDAMAAKVFEPSPLTRKRLTHGK
jgi:hypothetical protein